MSLQNHLIVLLPGTTPLSDGVAAALRDFLITPIGQALMRQLIYLRPTVSGDDPEIRRIRSDERAGYEACIQDIINLAEPPQAQPVANT